MQKEALKVLASIALGLSFACGAPASDAHSRSGAPPAHRPPPDSLDPKKAPHAWSLFNVEGLKAHTSGRRLVAFLGGALPSGVALDDVKWLAVDGPEAIDSPLRNIRIAMRRSGEVVTTQGKNAAPRTPDLPEPPRATELVRVRVRAPAKMIRVPFAPPVEVEWLTLDAEARDDGGADLHLREHCPNASCAEASRAALQATLDRVTSTQSGRELLKGLLDHARVDVDGNDTRLDVTATAEQLEALVDLALTFLGGVGERQ